LSIPSGTLSRRFLSSVGSTSYSKSSLSGYTSSFAGIGATGWISGWFGSTESAGISFLLVKVAGSSSSLYDVIIAP